MKLSSLYDYPWPTQEQLNAHLVAVADECRGLEPINHQLRIACESAPGATRQGFIAAAVVAGYNAETAGRQYYESRKLTKIMNAEDGDFTE